jgi:hypothetical protein
MGQPQPQNPAPAPKRPTHVFVLNDTQRPITLLTSSAVGANAEETAKAPSKHTLLGPGLNLVDANVVTDAGLDVDAKMGGRVRKIETTRDVYVTEATEMVTTSASRQAVRAWGEVDRRPEVQTAIAARLKVDRATNPDVDDE